MKDNNFTTVLYSHPNNDYTGSTRVLADIIIQKRNVENAIVLTSNRADGCLSEIKDLKIVDLPYFRYKGKKKILKVFNIFFDFINHIIRFLYTLYYQRSVDKVYINTILPFSSALAARLGCKKIIYHIHEKILLKPTAPFDIVAEFVFNKIPATRIFVSNYTKNCYPENPCCESKVIYNKLGRHFIENINIKPIKSRNLNTILLICSLSRNKGIYTFIELARVLPKYRFIMVISAMMEEIQTFLDFKELPTNIIIYPKQREVSKIIRESDILVNLSIPELWIETFGLTILEGMAYGLPVIAPNIGGPLEIVTDEEDGYLVDVTSISTLKSKIVSLLSDRDKYETMSKNAVKKSVKFF